MSNELKATDAKNIADGISNELKRSRMEFCCEAIRKAAQGGRYSICLPTEQVDSITADLAALGYEINILDLQNTISISWR